jgi:DNA-binding NarL/FixJ family response regulator
MTSTIRVLLADDHALVREGLKQLFALDEGILIVGEAINGTQVLELLKKERFDIVLLDMTMPGIAGPDLIVRILAHTPPPPILVLSMHNEPQIVRRALTAGASGYITKDSDPTLLLSAIRRIAGGGRFIDPVLAEIMAFDFPSTSVPKLSNHETLTSREYQIFLLVAKGTGVNDIAAELAISNKTVSTHKARLMEKMGFANNADLVRYAMINGLID